MKKRPNPPIGRKWPVTLDHTYDPRAIVPRAKRRRRSTGGHEWLERKWDDRSIAKVAIATLVPMLPFILLLLLAAAG